MVKPCYKVKIGTQSSDFDGALVDLFDKTTTFSVTIDYKPSTNPLSLYPSLSLKTNNIYKAKGAPVRSHCPANQPSFCRTTNPRSLFIDQVEPNDY